MASQPRKLLSPEEYLAIERAAEFRSEFYAGEMFAMSGGSRTHSLITGNAARSLGNQFEGHSCEVHSSDMCVKVSPTGLYTYPDVAAFCGKGAFEDDHVDTLLNPQLIVEVLSPSMEAYDRGEKFVHYRSIASLQEYLLIFQERVFVERYRRFEGDDLISRVFTDLDDKIELASVDATLRLADIYARVEFGDDDRPTSPEQ